MREILPDVDRMAKELGGTVSVAVRDIKNAFDLSLNAEEQMGAASTIKVPILIEALRQVKLGRLQLSTEYALRGGKSCGGSGVISHLSDGMLFSVKDLLTLMIIVSDNTATNAMIDIVGIGSVNATMQSMGYRGIALNRKMYDWEALEQGRDNFVVASEMADLLARVAGGRPSGVRWTSLRTILCAHSSIRTNWGCFCRRVCWQTRRGRWEQWSTTAGSSLPILSHTPSRSSRRTRRASGRLRWRWSGYRSSCMMRRQVKAVDELREQAVEEGLEPGCGLLLC